VTETLVRPGGGRPPGPGRRGPAGAARPRATRRSLGSTSVRGLLLPGLLGAAGAAALLLVAVEVVVLLAWAADSRAGASSTEALRVGAALWLASLHSRVHAGAAVLGLPPLGLTLGATLLVARAAATLTRSRAEQGLRRPGWGAEALAVAAAVAFPYALLAGVVAAVAGTPVLHPSVPTALVGGLAVGLAGAGVGVARARRATGEPPLLSLLPPAGGAAAAGGLAAVLALAAAASAVAAVALARHGVAAGQAAGAVLPGAVGGAVLVLLEVCLVPGAAVWSLAWLAGPGFAVGDGTSVTPWGTTLGRVPAVPLLAALPSGLHGPGAGVLVVPVLAGVLGGLVVARRSQGLGWGRLILRGAAAGPVAALLAAAAAAAASGPAGAGRLLTVGPSAWRVGLAVLAEVAVGAALAAGCRGWWRARAGPPRLRRVIGPASGRVLPPPAGR